MSELKRCTRCGGSCGGGYTSKRGRFIPCKYGTNQVLMAAGEIREAARLIRSATRRLKKS